MKMTMSTPSTLAPRIHRKVLRVTAKRLNSGHNRNFSTGKGRAGILRMPGSLDPCENSSDSGLGFDHNMDYPLVGRSKFMDQRDYHWPNENRADALRKRKLEIKLETDEANDNYSFPESTNSCKEPTTLIRTAPSSVISSLGRTGNHNSSPARAMPRCSPLTNRRSPTGPITLTTQLGHISRSGKAQLQIVCQPEQQHRARYQTEGSRGAVKDRTGNGFPVVKLIGYDKPATLQVFIGTDMGRVAPHMFYQACRVSGKNSTPCVEKKIEGTIVIEVELDPTKEMMVTCDCVGILKERNVDVEHRFPDQSGPRSKKKSTRCRMVFRTTITHDDGSTETLQTSSQPIVCTQPPGVPEICKKSLTMCPTTGNIELFILGKNFLKDTRVVFQQSRTDVQSGDREVIWEETVAPDKEYLQQTHLVCVVPSYVRHDIGEPVPVSLFVVSSGKTSEPHQFMYTPSPSNGNTVASPAFMPARDDIRPVMLWQTMPEITPKAELDVGMMPPPASLMPLSQRRPSTNMSMIVPESLKTEMLDDNSASSDMGSTRFNENSLDVHAGDSDMSLSDNSMDDTNMIRRPLPLLHHENSNMSLKNENSRDLVLGSHLALSDNARIALAHDTRMVVSMTHRNISLHNENSMDGVVMSRTRSLLGHSDNSNMSMIVNDNSMDTMRINENSMTMRRVTEAMDIEMPHRPPVSFSQATTLMGESAAGLITTDDLKGIDLRMKAPMATAADLSHTQSPSLATLRRFTDSTVGSLPAQSGQSVENYLTTIENAKAANNQNLSIGATQIQAQKLLLPGQKLDLAAASLYNAQQQAVADNQIFGQAATTNQSPLNPIESLLPQARDQSSLLLNGTAATKALYTNQELAAPQSIANDILASTNLSNTNSLLSNITESQIITTLNSFSQSSDAMSSMLFTTAPANAELTKTEAVLALLSATQPVITDSLLSQVQAQRSAAQSAAAARLDALVVSAMDTNILNPTPDTAKLDALVNSAVETHIGSPPMVRQTLSPTSGVTHMSPVSHQTSPTHTQASPSSQDHILQTQPSSTHDVMINQQAPILPQTQTLMSSPQAVTNVLSPDIILNSQVSPNLLCRNNTGQDSLLLNSQVSSLNTMCQGASLSVPNNSTLSINHMIPIASQEPVLSPSRKVAPVAVKNLLLNASLMDSQSQETLHTLLQEQSLDSSSAVGTAGQHTGSIEQRLSTMFQTSEADASAVQVFSATTTTRATALLTNSPSDASAAYMAQAVVAAVAAAAAAADNKPVIPVVDKEMPSGVNSIAAPGVAAAAGAKERLITQEITTMSDTDLLSYINPSCFDQV